MDIFFCQMLKRNKKIYTMAARANEALQIETKKAINKDGNGQQKLHYALKEK